MRALSASIAIALACGLGACGGAGASRKVVASTVASGEAASTITTSSIPPGQPVRGDSDTDNPSDIDGNGDIDSRTTPTDPGTWDSDQDGPTPDSYRYPDSDDRAPLAYGVVPDAPQRRAITALVTRYYAAAVRGDGAAACAMIYPPVARTVVEDYGSGAGPAYLRAGSCAGVMSKLFQHFRSQLTEAVRILAERVRGRRGEAVIASRVMPASQIFLQRTSRGWTTEQPFGQLLP